MASRSRTTLATFLETFLAKLEVADNTRGNYLSSRDTLIAFFGTDCKPETLTKKDAEAYRDYLKTSGRLDGKGGYGKNSVWKKLQHANQFFREMSEENLIRRNPFEKVKESPENATDRKSYVSDESIRRALEAAPTWEWKLLITLWRYAGMRRTCEPLRLRWSDVDWERKLIRVFSSKTKHERYVPIFPEIAQPLKMVYEQRKAESDWVIVEACPKRFRHSKDRAAGMKNANLGKRFDEICHQAGLPVMRFAGNNMRASCEKDLYSGKYPELRGRIDAIAAILGHSAATAVKYYNRYCVEDLERLTDSFEPIFPNDNAELCEILEPASVETRKIKDKTQKKSVKKCVKQEEKRPQSEQGIIKPISEVPCFSAPEKIRCKATQKNYPRPGLSASRRSAKEMISTRTPLDPVKSECTIFGRIDSPPRICTSSAAFVCLIRFLAILLKRSPMKSPPNNRSVSIFARIFKRLKETSNSRETAPASTPAIRMENRNGGK